MISLIAQTQSCIDNCLKTNPYSVCIQQCGGSGTGAFYPIKNPALSSALQGFSGVGFFNNLLPRLVGLAFVIGVVIFFFVMILGAIQWIISGGDKASLEAARSKVINALVGIVILLSLFAVIKLVEDFFGINILTLDIGPLIIQ